MASRIASNTIFNLLIKSLTVYMPSSSSLSLHHAIKLVLDSFLFIQTAFSRSLSCYIWCKFLLSLLVGTPMISQFLFHLCRCFPFRVLLKENKVKINRKMLVPEGGQKVLTVAGDSCSPAPAVKTLDQALWWWLE